MDEEEQDWGKNQERYKYIWQDNGQDMLFDVVNDPDERWNIIREKPEVAKRMRTDLERFLMSIEQRCYQDMFRPGRNRNTEVVRRLCAWGLHRPGVIPPWDPGNPQEPMDDKTSRQNGVKIRLNSESSLCSTRRENAQQDSALRDTRR